MTDPSIETDEAYIFEDDDLWDALLMQIPLHNPLYTESNFPEKETPFIILLTKKEIYFRLATSTAPFYPLEAEGAKLRKDFRFEHYMTLIRQTEKTYDKAWDKFVLSGGTISVSDILLPNNHFSIKNYEKANIPEITLTLSNITSSTVNLDWTKFSVNGGSFWKYEVYISKSSIYDEYENTYSDEAVKVEEFIDIHRVKARLKNLEEKTTYHVLLASYDINGLKGIHELEFTTL